MRGRRKIAAFNWPNLVAVVRRYCPNWKRKDRSALPRKRSARSDNDPLTSGLAIHRYLLPCNTVSR